MSNFKTKAEHLKHLHECLKEDMEMLFNSLHTLDSIAEQAKEPTAGVLKLMGNAWNMVRGMAVALDVASEMAVKLVEQSLLEQPPKPASEPKCCNSCKHDNMTEDKEPPCLDCNKDCDHWEPKEGPVVGCDTCLYRDVDVHDAPCTGCGMSFSHWVQWEECLHQKVAKPLPGNCKSCQYRELDGDEWPCSGCDAFHNFYEPAGLVEELSKKAKPEPDLELEINGCGNCKYKHSSNLLSPCNDCNGINRWETDKTKVVKRCHTCKHLESGRFSHPCNICEYLNKWEKEE